VKWLRLFMKSYSFSQGSTNVIRLEAPPATLQHSTVSAPSRQKGLRAAAALVLIATALWNLSGFASATVTVSDPAALQSAIRNGGTLRLAFDATVILSNTFLIATNTTIDATGHSVSLEGGARFGTSRLQTELR
jgi:hypothetical protein